MNKAYSLIPGRRWRLAAVLLGLLGIGVVVVRLGTGLWGENDVEAQQAVTPDRMAYIPGGKFLMGSTGREARVGFQIGVDEKPQQQADVKPIYIDL
jgi:formylglycine-generating enzyme required for sulfatase activity